MKKILLAVLCVVMIFVSCACGDDSSVSAKNVPEASANADSETLESKAEASDQTGETSVDGDVDVDLTVLSSTMVYSEVYNMVTTPEDYDGKTVKMQGEFATQKDKYTGKRYFACIIKDATACCAQGLEFVPGDDVKYPDDYLKQGSELTVTGTFHVYSENGFDYYHLTDAVFE